MLFIMKNLIKTIQNTSFQNNLWQKESKIVLGVSGGADSVCLLDIFAKLQKKYNLKIIIAHLNYGLRKKDSDKDEKFVQELGKKYGLNVKILSLKKRNVLKYSENWMREIRYNFFEKIRKENNFDLIAVAHNSDDQVETFLARVIRGSGLKGLSAIQYKNNHVIRPLLNISRKEIIGYLKKNNLKFRIDKTNFENKYFRNKIRNQLIPYLEKKFNPAIKKTLFNAIISIADDYDFINKSIEKIQPKFKQIKISALLKLHPALQKRILLFTIKKTKGSLKDIEIKHIEEIIKTAKKIKGGKSEIFLQGLKIICKNDKILLLKK